MLLSFGLAAQRSSAQTQEARMKIQLSITAQGKQLTTDLNSISTSVSRYYDELQQQPSTTAKASDSVKNSSNLPKTTYSPGAFYLNMEIRSMPDELLKVLASKGQTFDGKITITDTYGKTASRTLSFTKASLYSYTDQFASTYYADSYGSASVSFSCKTLSINGIAIDP